MTEIRNRVRARYPEGEARGLGIALPDLFPIVHARDRAESKVASIGSVNPRPAGFANDLIQWVKRTVARSLGWFVRDQVEFNRSILSALEATLETLNEVNRALAAAGARIDDSERGVRHDLERNVRQITDKLDPFQAKLDIVFAKADPVQARLDILQPRLEDLQVKLDLVPPMFEAVEARLDSAQTRLDAQHCEVKELVDIRAHWVHWREEWQQKLFQNEVYYLRGLSELQALLDVRLSKLDEGYRQSLQLQHSEYERALRTATDELQRKFWEDLQKVRLEYEAVIHQELRLIRQRAPRSHESAQPVAPSSPASSATPAMDYQRFAARFRGSEEYVRDRQKFYLPWFEGRTNVLDVGCGRGEFLELLRDAGVPATGLDLDEESVAICVSKGLRAETGDVFDWLAQLPDGQFDGIFASQVIEHLTPEQLPDFVRLCIAKLRVGGVIALETPNPECLAIFATHFYLDPTHHRPVPSALLTFYYEESGLGGIEVHRLSPASESMPSIEELPTDFAEAFFGSLDYCAIGRKL
ncbi:MAG: methyltransferase domain-containing protein [Bryobacteraceae bacterium]|nr:methyltransferase domain-containing protein [Bryobacteraceae bacterium]